MAIVQSTMWMFEVDAETDLGSACLECGNESVLEERAQITCEKGGVSHTVGIPLCQDCSVRYAASKRYLRYWRGSIYVSGFAMAIALLLLALGALALHGFAVVLGASVAGHFLISRLSHRVIVGGQYDVTSPVVWEESHDRPWLVFRRQETAERIAELNNKTAIAYLDFVKLRVRE